MAVRSRLGSVTFLTYLLYGTPGVFENTAQVRVRLRAWARVTARVSVRVRVG